MISNRASLSNRLSWHLTCFIFIQLSLDVFLAFLRRRPGFSGARVVTLLGCMQERILTVCEIGLQQIYG